MNTTLALPVALGLALGSGIVVMIRALALQSLALSRSLQRLEGVGVSVAALTEDDQVPVPVHSAIRHVGRVQLLGQRSRDADLAVTGRTVERHGMEKLTTSVSLGALPLITVILLRLTDVVVPIGLAVIVSVAASAVGFLVPDLVLVSQARQRRRAFRYALSAYLDLVNVLLAGGAGIETALVAAAEAGDGWAFARIREVLVRSRAARSSPWVAFAELGRHLDIAELIELAASVELAGEQGARIRMSLVAKAEALRGRHAAEVEAQANAATERMGLPTVLMFLGFLVLLGYPATVTVVGGIGG